MVYLLWSSDGEDKRIEEVCAEKITAEALMRKYKEQDEVDGRVYHYSIQEKEVI